MAAPPPLISLKDAMVTFGGRPLFEGLEVQLTTGDKAALVGRNGSGKSTLMKVLAGLTTLDGGGRFVQPGARVAYLPQEPDLSGYATVLDYVVDGLPEAERDQTYRAEAMLEPLTLDPDRTPATLSGGEGRRAALARTLVGAPEALLLDEPTNHLDLPTIEWLEGLIRGYRGALLLISHDRTFLSNLTNKTLWLDRGAMRVRESGFAGFEAWTEQVFEEEAQQRHKMDRLLAQEGKWAVEGISARRKRNQGRLRRLQDMRKERSEQVARTGSVQFDPAEAQRSGRIVIEAEHLTKTYPAEGGGTYTAVADFSTRILRGDRIGLIGPNGAGKSTLVKMLTGAVTPDQGTVKLGANVQTAYFDQTRAQLNPEATVKEAILPLGGDMVQVGDPAAGGRSVHIATYLREFLFDPGRKDSPIKSLSGGERNRLLLARLFAQPSNLLVLDEPTNDLDMETLDLLQEVLGDYAGTILVVSHDRDFLDRLVTAIIAVEGDGVVGEYVGGYADYLRQRPKAAEGQRREATPKTGQKSGLATGATQARAQAPTPKKPAKLSYKDQRTLDQLPGRIDALQTEIARLTEELADPNLFTRNPDGFQAKSARLDAARDELDAAETRWLELTELAEALAG